MKSFARGGGKKTPPLPKNWKLVKEKDGAFGKEKVYYYNTVTNQTSHEPPPPLPKGWKEALHKDSGRVYYYNKVSANTTQSPSPTPPYSRTQLALVLALALTPPLPPPPARPD